MAVPVACLHGTGLRRGRDRRRRTCHLLERHAEAALPAGRHRPDPGRQAETVDCIWVVGPGSYGRSDADDCGNDCAVIAKAVGKPVRLQYMRNEGTGWDPKGPASIHRARAAIDANGQVIGYEFLSKGFSRVDVNTNGSQPRDTLAGHFRGIELRSGDNFGVPAESYAFANKQTAWETIPPFLDRASPLRSSHLRDPVGPQIHFASESFMDEIAYALGVDPLELRLRHVKNPRACRGAPGGGEEGRLAVAAVAEQRPERQHRERPRHRLCGAQRHDRCDRRRGRGRPHDRQGLGAEVHGRA